jgi:hypothetical protein
MMFKFWFTNSEKLRAMIKRCITNATCSQATAGAFAFV